MNSPLKAWVRALESGAPVERGQVPILPVLINDLAERFGPSPALVSRERQLNYAELAAAVNRYARWALSQQLTRGDVVCLLMGNCPEYMAIWMGLSRIGVTVSLLNTNLRGELLAHAIRVVMPRVLITDGTCCNAVQAARALLDSAIICRVHGAADAELSRLEPEVERLPTEPVTEAECPRPALDERALYIYTSGTTGLPKAANVSHLRILQWMYWFAGMLDTQPQDRMYNCLPMYHSIGGVVATGALLVHGGAVIVRERFSASEFWTDVRDARCTLFQYIGELCRYLLATPSQPEETQHALRLCCGNGLRAEVWNPFQERFRIPQILEYYAATEASFSLYNCEGRPGAIGRIPPFLAHRLPVALVKFDREAQEPVRDATGRCERCAPNEVGEAIGQLSHGKQGGRFEGYADAEASKKKILRDVFEPGDAWYRTGDLMRRDEQGFFYFVDRVGDTFRWKGENVATTEVASVLTSCPGVLDAVVYGVAVPGTEGRAGMAALVIDSQFDLATFKSHVDERLPEYARPMFLRIVSGIELTGTFRLRKSELAAQGFDPEPSEDHLYFVDRTHGTYVPLDGSRHADIRSGNLRV